jgi:hypothetical protein
VAAVAAEVSAVHNISHARAVNQVHMANVLRHRLPRVAAELRSGVIDFRVVSMIVARTDNVDDEVMAELDAAIARHAMRWMKLSKPKLRDRVDQWVATFDPAGVRVAPLVEDSRYVEIEPTQAGMAGVSGNIHAADGAALDQRLDALAATVCDNDPRSKAQRRADACGPLARGEASLACHCGAQDCPANAGRQAAVSAVVHVLAEQGTLDGSSDNPGYLRGFGVLPAESVRQLATTAQLKPLAVPGADAGAEPGYRPSAQLKQFLWWRDLTCRWPECDRPVQQSDVDHTLPWPQGPTHPSNMKCYCRIHHLVKTFGGWSDQQLPDGTVILRSPAGDLYASEAHGAAMFPALGRWRAELDLPEHRAADQRDRSVRMPKRRQTRAQDRRDRITAERRQRTEMIAEEQRHKKAWIAANYAPPPF